MIVDTAALERVLYLGPLDSVTDDEGRSYPRGVAVDVPRSKWLTIQKSPAAAQFTRLAPV